MTESAAYRALVRLSLIGPEARRPRDRKWKRWERGAPMELWQMDVESWPLRMRPKTATVTVGASPETYGRFDTGATGTPAIECQLGVLT